MSRQTQQEITSDFCMSAGGTVFLGLFVFFIVAVVAFFNVDKQQIPTLADYQMLWGISDNFWDFLKMCYSYLHAWLQTVLKWTFFILVYECVMYSLASTRLEFRTWLVAVIREAREPADS